MAPASAERHNGRAPERPSSSVTGRHYMGYESEQQGVEYQGAVERHSDDRRGASSATSTCNNQHIVKQYVSVQEK